MSDLVELEHDTMPGRTISVPERGVWHRERAGWRRVVEALEGEHQADGETSSSEAADESTPASDRAAGRSRSTGAPSDDTTETEH